MNKQKSYKGFYASELHTHHKYEDEKVIHTSLNANFFNGYTTLGYGKLDGEIEGADVVLTVVLKELYKHKEALENGKRVDILVEWTLSEDRSEYTSCLLLGYEYTNV